MTNELPLVHRALSKRRVPVTTLHVLKSFDGETATLAHIFTGEESRVPCRSVLIVGLRLPRDELHDALTARADELAAAGIRSVDRIGDALAPGAIVHAVHSGHKLARELGSRCRAALPPRHAHRGRCAGFRDAHGSRIEGEHGTQFGTSQARSPAARGRRHPAAAVEAADAALPADRDPVGRPGAGDPRDGADHPRRDRHARAAAARRGGSTAQAGADVDEGEMRVRFDRAFVMERIATAPSSFELRARNPEKNVKVGGPHCILSSVGGPAYVMDNDRGRRPGTYAEMCDYLKLIQSFNVLHQEGGGPFEPLDLHQNTRHLDLYYAEITLLDKNWQPQTLGTGRAIDALEMVAISLGTTREKLADEMPVFTGIINTNSPLQLDEPMAEGLIAMAEHGQVNVITPFTLAGAMSPVTLAGALAQQHAEALAGIVLTQIVRPGVPVMYGGFTSNVDMKTGAPAFGTPEYTQAAQITGPALPADRRAVPL